MDHLAGTFEICRRLSNGEPIASIRDVLGTCYACDVTETPLTGKECPSYENVVKSKKEYAVSCRIQQDEQDHIRGKLIKQRHGNKMLVQNPPMPPLTQEEMDDRCELSKGFIGFILLIMKELIIRHMKS